MEQFGTGSLDKRGWTWLRMADLGTKNADNPS
jgi:hypothetical protein